MKPIHLLLSFIFLSSCASICRAQVSVSYLMSRKPEFQTRYTSHKDLNGIRVKMNFADDSILNPGVVQRLKGQTILMIDLVYTDYRSVKTFDQPFLNENRLKKLQRVLPSAFQNAAIVWNFIAQTGCNSSELCEDYFHGFVIYYREPVTEKSHLAEIDKMECAMTSKVVIDTIRTHRVARSYMYEPRSKARRDAGILYENRSIWFRKEVLVRDTIPLKRPRTRKRTVVSYSGDCTAATAAKPLTLVSHAFVWGADSVVQTVLNRNEDWKDMVVAVDVTGSMWPYTSQVYAWLGLQTNLQRVRSFTFFNDGDNKPDHIKKTGATGGIYDCNSNKLENILAEGRKAMYAGGGGDAPENNVEAILHICDKRKDVKEIILIADNFANMRDFALIEEVHVPVRVILCGSTFGVNTEYLRLARATGGSVHTIEQDIIDLAAKQEGEVIKIGKQNFKIIDGQFWLVIEP